MMFRSGADRFSTVSRVPFPFPTKTAYSAESAQGGSRTRQRQICFARFSDILHENSLSGSVVPESNLSHQRTSSPSIIHQTRKKINTLRKICKIFYHEIYTNFLSSSCAILTNVSFVSLKKQARVESHKKKSKKVRIGYNLFTCLLYNIRRYTHEFLEEGHFCFAKVMVFT